MKGVQCYELFGGIALKINTFSFSFHLCFTNIHTHLDIYIFRCVCIFVKHDFFLPHISPLTGMVVKENFLF